MATANSDTVNGVNGESHLAHVSAEEFCKQEYDYLICGGGTAGLVVAARLTENPDVTVGVIEAGKNKLGDMLVDTPALFLQMLGNPEYDYNYHTVPQAGNKNVVHHISRGKMLGGSSGINYMMYVRGSLQDYDDWASISGDSSWDAASMKPYMLKHQTLEPIDPSITDRTSYPFVGQHHGTSGPVRTSFNETALPIEDDFIKAADHAAGFSKKPIDPWSGDHIGFFCTLGAVARSGPNRGKRSYAARGYYQANEQRPNLKVVTEATVSRIILEGQGQEKTATGVEFISNETRQKLTVKARREVIVSAGTVASPQILELSGIGDPAVLSKAGIECQVDLPSVGTDLQDHQLLLLGTHLTEGNMSGDSIHKPENMAAAQKALMEAQTGPLTNIACVQGFFPAKIFLDDDEIAEIEKLVKETKVESDFQRRQLDQMLAQIQSDKSANLQFVVVPAVADLEGVKDQSKLFPPPADPNNPINGITMALCLQYGASRGHIHITSSDPYTYPEIDPGYLSHPADVILLAAGLKFLDKVTSAPSLAGKIAKRYYPPESVDLSDRQTRRDTVREWVMSEYHLIGTCAMGHTVDTKLKVKGVGKLRVVDASTFANNVSGNIVSSVYAVAEKGADLIKEEWNLGALKGVKV